MGKNTKKKGGFRKIMVRVLALLGAFFILIMLLPEDEPAEDEKARSSAKISDKQEKKKEEKSRVKRLKRYPWEPTQSLPP